MEKRRIVPVFECGKNGEKNSEGIASYRIPALLKTKKGTLIAGADRRREHSYDWGKIDLVVRRSQDNGESWEAPITLVDLRENLQGEDPGLRSPFNIDMVLLQDPSTERIFALYDMWVEGRGTFGMLEEDKPYDRYSHIEGQAYLNIYKEDVEQPYTVREGGIVFSPEGEPTSFKVVMQSDKAPYTDLGDLYEGDRLRGNIFHRLRQDNPFTITAKSFIWLSYSDDEGQTWSCPRDITGQVYEPWMAFLGIGPGVGIALKQGEHEGRLVVPIYTTNDSRELKSQAARIIFSDDHGQTWQCGASVNDGRVLSTGEVIQSATFADELAQTTEAVPVELTDGRIKLFTRNLNGHVQVATSVDGGQTWNQFAEYPNQMDVYCQLSAVQTIQDNKEYVLVANANGPARTNGVLRVAEVLAEGELKWLGHSLIQEGAYAYNALQQVGPTEFGVLYEHTEEPYNDYHLLYQKIDWSDILESLVE
ncbi:MULTISPECIES: exo-alpha-sialidase [unclassified Streptococcus]|uniref:sialidase family protein n=1 Tax=unclassified Streptococcus TaxID=2608887 RepID=UPI001071A282|nr:MULTISPECIES: sialidase family protein [unclassified Streptococcus]MBF0787111.1 exo-alpha-sialidase [Streptococcus sp. 19428wC2_LYSM12]MCQ9211333.1 glycoside hydrolase [Streptococcus sp. B01]MCQ9214645.1 glycoside hydrolase [Streptococcus sp. O1]TFV05995.1 exo-alpha-sialidase [Streptococcus sp. LYSM12]